jgi:micrococcal nuclease
VTHKGLDWPFCRGKLEAMKDCIVDGDTVRIGFQSYRIGTIDTGETRRPGPECPEVERAKGEAAKAMAQKLLKEAGTVTVTFFIHPLFNEPTRDKFGRFLVLLDVDGVDVSEALLEAGLAQRYDGRTKLNWCN